MHDSPSAPLRQSVFDNRWLQLTAGIIAMVAVANFQYGWPLFAPALEARHGWSRLVVGDSYFFFLLAQTWLVPIEGYLADRFGPRRVLISGAVLAGLAWVVLAHTHSLVVLIAAQILCGCGSGIVYGISMGNALKWFPDRRGFAAGITAAGFGAGSALTVVPIQMTIKQAGYGAAFFWFGLGQGIVVILAGLCLRFPTPRQLADLPRPPVLQTTRDYSPTETIRAPLFWLLYLMMTLGAIPGLLMTGEMSHLAEDFGVTSVLALALMVDRVLGGLTRPFFGWISDWIGREQAMFVAFTLEGISLLLLVYYGPSNPVWFVVLSGIAFFGWGAVFSLFPAAAADLFGRKFATANNGMLYTAKGTATLLLFLLIRLREAYGWGPVFAVMIAFDWLAALLALFVLLPLRKA